MSTLRWGCLVLPGFMGSAPEHFAMKGTAHAVVQQLDAELRKYIHIENTCFTNVRDGGCLNYDDV